MVQRAITAETLVQLGLAALKACKPLVIIYFMFGCVPLVVGLDGERSGALRPWRWLQISSRCHAFAHELPLFRRLSLVKEYLVLLKLLLSKGSLRAVLERAVPYGLSNEDLRLPTRQALSRWVHVDALLLKEDRRQRILLPSWVFPYLAL